MAQGILGLAVFIAAAWLFSENRRGVSVKAVATGLAVQFATAALLIKLPGIQLVFLALNRAVEALQDATRTGTSFVFGYIGGGPLPFAETHPGASFNLAFQACRSSSSSARFRRCCFIGASSPPSCAPSPGSCARPWPSGARSVSWSPPTSSSA